jgi:hypothetical protein
MCLLAALAFTFWSGTLVVMAITSANPTLVSRDQILHADDVIVARIDDPERDSVRVERVLSGKLAVDDRITVLNLRDAMLPGVLPRRDRKSPPPHLKAVDKSLVLPLSRFRQDYVVTVLDGPVLVYPAEPRFIDPIRKLLREVRQ